MMTGQIKMTLLILNTVYAHRHRNSAVWRSSPYCSLQSALTLACSYHIIVFWVTTVRH